MLQTRPQLATDPPPPPPPRAGLPCISPISPYISLQAVPPLSLLSDDFYQAANPSPNPNPSTNPNPNPIPNQVREAAVQARYP